MVDLAAVLGAAREPGRADAAVDRVRVVELVDGRAHRPCRRAARTRGLRPAAGERLAPAAGAHCRGSARNQIEISSPATYIPNKIYEFKLISDISQIMTYITLSVYHNLSLILSNITIDSVREGLKTEFRYLKDMGINLLFKNDTIEICKKPTLSKLDIEVTSIGIYSDHQPLFAIMLLEAENNSTIKELVWKLRFSYATQLKKLGLLLEVDENQLMIYPSSS